MRRCAWVAESQAQFAQLIYKNSMTLADLDNAVRSSTPLPDAVPPLVRALWHDAIGDWNQAHAVAQDVETADGAWVHAYLHRKEGDLGNAGYWYRRAGKPPATGPLEAEWRQIAAALLGEGPVR